MSPPAGAVERRSCYFFAPCVRHTTADEPVWFSGLYLRVCGHGWSNYKYTYKNKPSLTLTVCVSLSPSLSFSTSIQAYIHTYIHTYMYIRIFRLYISYPNTHLSPFSCSSLSHTLVAVSLALSLFIYIFSLYICSLFLSLCRYIETVYVHHTHTHTH